MLDAFAMQICSRERSRTRATGMRNRKSCISWKVQMALQYYLTVSELSDLPSRALAKLCRTFLGSLDIDVCVMEGFAG
jgi:hypothetical protein